MDEEEGRREKRCGFDYSCKDETSGWRSTEPDICGVDDGISKKLDGGGIDVSSQFVSEWSSVPRVAYGIKNRVDRLKSLGNAIVPQVAFSIFSTIKDIEEGKSEVRISKRMDFQKGWI
jgi:hypothetical protein